MTTKQIKKINITNTLFTQPDSFRCTVNNCGSRVIKTKRFITEHLLKHHPTISSKMHLNTRQNPVAFHCDTCDMYSTAPHAICLECENPENGGKVKCFPSAKARDEHLKTQHLKWWFEYECKFGSACRGKMGGCGFNHVHTEKNHCTSVKDIPAGFCRYDCPWDNVRCYRDKCSFNHFWGRVRFLIKSRAEASKKVDKPVDETVVAVEADEADETVVAVEADEADETVVAVEADVTVNTDTIIKTTPSVTFADYITEIKPVEPSVSEQDLSALDVAPTPVAPVVASEATGDEEWEDVFYDDDDDDATDFVLIRQQQKSRAQSSRGKQGHYTSRHVREQMYKSAKAAERRVK